MESPNQNDSGNETERMMAKFINAHPEFAAKKFSTEEIRQASALVNAQEMSVDEDLLQRALEARLSVRGTEGNMPIMDNTDTMIGVANSMGEARKIVRGENENRGAM